jgi:energy-coupling factor transporter ATP-binding protein EcfA2
MDPEKVTYFAETDARNSRVEFGIKAKDRTRHVYVIGKTGMGKSTLLENMAIQDIQGGEGMAFVDPHGKTADLLLDYVPEERIKDVVYFAPFDTDHPISFNVMEDVGVDKRHLVANGLMSAFKKIWVDAWSARMEYILNNTILALLEYPDSTLIGINRMLSDKGYRKKVVENISDPSVKSFWVDEFEKYGERYMQEAGAAIQNKVGQFVSNPLVRNIIGQPKSTFDLRKIMDEKKIVIINLSKGRVGEQNANLLGSMLITKIYLAAMSRADIADSALKTLPNFYLYVDEFQSFANESFADILSEARKYKLNLTIAHQYIEQMSEEVRAAVFGNVGTMVAFRVGAFDAEVLEKEFAPTFTAEDLVNLGFVQIYLKLMIDGVSSRPFSARTSPPIEKGERTYRDEIVDSSRALFARPREAVEEAIRKWHEETNTNMPPERRGSPPTKGGFREARQVKKEVNQEKKAAFEQIIAEEKEAEAPKQNPVSLSSLEKSAPKKNKGPSSSHVSELRQALAQLTKKDTAPEVPRSNPPTGWRVPSLQPTTQQSAPEQKKTEQESPKQEPRPEKPRKNEIPKDELLNLLRVDSER